MTQSWTWKVGRTLLLAAIAMFYTTSHTLKAQGVGGACRMAPIGTAFPTSLAPPMTAKSRSTAAAQRSVLGA